MLERRCYPYLEFHPGYPNALNHSDDLSSRIDAICILDLGAIFSSSKAYHELHGGQAGEVLRKTPQQLVQGSELHMHYLALTTQKFSSLENFRLT
jgi:hypothetical protein